MTNRIPIASPVRTAAIVNRYFVHAKKNLGQNFLVDLDAVQGIVRAAGIEPGDQVVEVGPGIGSLTEQLLLAGGKVAAYEVDQSLPEILANELPEKVDGQDLDQRFKLIMKDVLKADFATDLAGFFDLSKPVKVVANLPYYITTPIIFNLLESSLDFTSLTLMMQKEVAERLAAQPGSKAYGPLSIAVQTQMSVDLALEVGHASFMPKPKVDSAVVVLTPLEKPADVGDRKQFNRVVKLCFAQRRKTLANNLKTLLPDKEDREKLLADLDLDPRQRPEQLAISDFIRISQAIAEMNK
ncbi:16S rRNA (adenine(1518)-N(6)/adenine(1519)-N(6))-dimethyltransferase [Lactobacillus delbrueckii subsp. delbrueckii]|jgi:16S rRNA (adenine1518-N6/adenine1519-N6)-dimethyltransferase|uniref:16S rRNA (adenine(1518)-N(6)/adenine(1519)-N(6))- dimethyltransferase RsmA n=1 Tax=Lactobacillus delbrueckii TaxID=1584 RepID=UPI00032FE3FB|nr:16S rRNA (adenine(1518)-N(6)/adenine(1519)-N(6))-dimethyltransferase RsmA [Lactobacillus delbrueckii]APG70874.1 16S rRNA (adenine(1518)-N(6)/adenine(1519)-N(6))-dimethyltransferase [Lactobacillus delbrueckii subsp. delbrueckii]APG72779.1 16S rRNA (adenine(1518)-N(6)/adenine(1519)-N(6))-dimethyltransferase [Lactobacillus delbrueckii subsp. jakobsenii ZN7a-9 = DSM 26046]EOD02814.1 16S ribosomal RNA methyltransferase KsgA/Dim1 family protein [Lactobacillus delbrueckii subsp. jakobsenii ZN7a-9 = 